MIGNPPLHSFNQPPPGRLVNKDFRRLLTLSVVSPFGRELKEGSQLFRRVLNPQMAQSANSTPACRSFVMRWLREPPARELPVRRPAWLAHGAGR